MDRKFKTNNPGKIRKTFIIDAEYILRNTEETIKYGIAGKIGRLRQRIPGNKHRYWVQVDKDVYNLSSYSISRHLVYGRYNVNMLDLLKSELFRGVEFNHGTCTLKQVVEKLYPGYTTKGLHSLREVPYFEFRVGRILAHIGPLPHLVIDNRIYVYENEDSGHLVVDFKNLTGKNLWTLVKAITYLELPLCVCKDKQQYWEEYHDVHFGRVYCRKCGQILFFAHGISFDTPEPNIEKIFEMNMPGGGYENDV